MVEANPEQFKLGLPFPTMETGIRKSVKKDADGKVVKDANGFPILEDLPSIKVPGHELMEAKHIEAAFNSYMKNMKGAEMVEGTVKNDEDEDVPTRGFNIDVKGKKEFVPIGRLEGLHLPDMGDARSFIDKFRLEARKSSSADRFVTWGLDESKGIKALLAKMIEDGAPGWDLVVKLIGSDLKNSTDPAEELLKDIWTVVNQLKQFDVLTEQAYSGDKGKMLGQWAVNNYGNVDGRKVIPAAVDAAKDKVVDKDPESYVPEKK